MLVGCFEGATGAEEVDATAEDLFHPSHAHRLLEGRAWGEPGQLVDAPETWQDVYE